MLYPSLQGSGIIEKEQGRKTVRARGSKWLQGDCHPNTARKLCTGTHSACDSMDKSHEDLIEDCLREQGLLVQVTPANQELLFRIDTFLGPMWAWVEGIKGIFINVQRACCSISHLLPESVSLTLHQLTPNPQVQVGSGWELSRTQATWMNEWMNEWMNMHSL